MDSINVKAAILIGVMALVVLWDIICQIRTGTGINKGTFILCALILILFLVFFRKKNPN